MQTINGFRLSPQQKYLWLLQQDSPAYRVQSAISLEGILQTERLKKALEKVSDRHEIIRTSFQRKAGLKIPIQVISEHSSVSWNWVNSSEVNPQEQEAKLEEIFQQEKIAFFNFDRNHVWHLSLITLSSERHILLVSLPALCADSRTLKNLVQEISQCYAACLHGEEITDEVVQYIQFSEWQNELLEDEEAAEGKEYWTGQNFSGLASLTLPFENRLINAPAQFNPQSFEVKLELALLVQVEAIARQYNTSLSTFLLACWKILLWRLIGQSQITVGVEFDGRKYEELEPALGLFAKFLPLSSQLTENFSFAESLQQIQQEEREAYKYQEYFSHEYLGNSSGFPFGFEFEEQLGKHSASGVFFSIYKQYACCDRFKVKLSCHRQKDSLAAEFHYDPIFLADNSIRCLAEQFYALVQSAATNPQTAIGKLEMLSDRARNQLLVEFNSTKADYQLDKCVHQLFEEQAERSPNRIAAVCENQQITYSELNARANQIAHYLQQLGIKPEVIVGICLDRSLEAIAGILGILKAGGAYLPLDPAMPKERLALMLQNAQTPVLLTQQHLINNLPETKAYIVCLDKDIPSFSPTTFVSASGENLAYIIYTSGSTGTPKGVAIEHRQLLNYLQGIQEKLNLPSGANYATVSTFAADLGNTVIFPALCSGGCLHIISQERATDPQAIAAYFQQHSIDCLKIVPSHLQALLSASNAAQILPKKRLILGGEPLMWNLIETIKKYNPDCSIFNHYGPTETTVGVLTYQVRMQGDRISQTVPLGRPLPNTQIYLLDSHLQPVPVGVAGELYIAGAGLARGYLNQPELTAEKFICKSLTQEPETRLYKTGDLARYLPDGNIEFIGRVDHQVKLRGFRIELGEIEAVLGQHPAVQKTVVMVREDVPGNKRLVAYVVVNQTSVPTVSQLHQFLKQKLPEYMIPSAIVKLEALPLTPNGKVDRRALLAPDTARPELQSAFVAPRDTLELQLVQIWEDVLNVRPIGVTDNFFTLGGHSLLAVRLIALLQQQFGQNLPLATLFLAPTIEHLASTLGQPTDERQWSPLVKIQSGGSKRPFFCVPGAGGNVIYFYHLARHLGSDQPFYGLQARGLDGEQMPHTQVEDMAACYIEALQTVQPQGPYLLGGHSFGSKVAFEMALQLLHQGQEVALLAILDTPAPLPTNKPVEVEHDDDARYLTELAMTIEQFVGKKLSVSYEHLQPLAPNEQLNYILERLKTANVFPPEAKLSQLRGLVQVFKANHQTHYVLQEVYPNQITVFPASEQFRDDPAMGWDKVSSEPVEIYSVPGDHNTMLAEPHVRVLAEKLRACLDKAQADDERK